MAHKMTWKRVDVGSCGERMINWRGNSYLFWKWKEVSSVLNSLNVQDNRLDNAEKQRLRDAVAGRDGFELIL